MPILTYNTPQGPRGGPLNSRVLIGRRLSYGISLPDPGVSRLHAWIDPVADEQADWVITDAGSKTGTFVNDQKITRHHLHDGDVIRAGPVTLKYQESDSIPPGVTPIEMIAPPPIVRDVGILFECACGAPLWVGNELAGKRGICRHCRQPVTVPSLLPDHADPAIFDKPSIEPATPLLSDAPLSIATPAAVPFTASVTTVATPMTLELISPAPISDSSDAARSVAEIAVDPPIENFRSASAVSSIPHAEPIIAVQTETIAEDEPGDASAAQAVARRKMKCAVCHAQIVPGEETTTCPDCAMRFHSECWTENLGCSSYGCPQVNCLAPAVEAQAKHQIEPETLPAVDDEKSATPWELILLAASVLSVLGAPLFGGIAAAVFMLCIIVLLKKREKKTALLVVAMIISLLSVAAGLVVSDLMYFDARHLPPVILRYIHY